MNANQFQSAEHAWEFIRGGKALVTFVGAHKRYTYKINAMKSRETGKPIPEKFFVSLLTGPDNTSDYTYIGILDHGTLRLTAKSSLTENSQPIKAFRFVTSRLANAILDPRTEVWHEGRCGRCGKVLTVPQSLEEGFGPHCAAQRSKIKTQPASQAA